MIVLAAALLSFFTGKKLTLRYNNANNINQHFEELSIFV